MRQRLPRALLLAFSLVGALPGCAEVQTYGAMAAQYRKQENDLQLAGTVLEMCDIAIGAYYRTTPNVRRAIDSVCNPDPTSIPALSDDRRSL